MRTFYCRALLFVLLLVVCAGGAIAQLNNVQTNYSVVPSTYVYVPVSTDNSAAILDLRAQTLSAGDLDQGHIQLQIPFNFTFNGDLSSPFVRVYTNGAIQPPRPPGYYINFTGDPNWFHQPGALSGYYTNIGPISMIFGFATDLDLTSSTTGWYVAVQGNAPNRRVVFEWRNALLKNTTTTVSFQVILSETTNAIDVVFGGSSGSLPSTGFQYYTGINEGTAAVGTVVAQKSYHGQAGNYIASRYTGAWEHTSNAGTPTSYVSTVFPANQGVRYCITPTLNVTAPNLTLFDAAANTSDRTSIGIPISRTYTYTNNASSTSPIKITTAISGSGASHYSVSPSTVTSLAPGATQSFTVTFNPSAFGDLPATLKFSTSTPDGATCPLSGPQTTLALNARAVGLSATGSLTVNFGAVAVNSVNSQNVMLFHNDATVPLVYYFTGPTPLADFSITGATGSPRVLSGTVPAGGNVYLPVEFRPTSQGSKSATVNFYYTNQAGTVRSLDQTISLLGEATPSRIKVTRGSNNHLVTGSVFSQSVFGAVGEDPLNFDFTVTNSGLGAPVTLRDFMFYDLDRDNSVNGRLRVMWTNGFGSGSPIASNDFRVQQLLNGEWVTVTAGDVVSVPAQQSRSMRVQFVPDRPGVNFVRMFFRTDATVDDNFGSIQTLNAGDVMTPELQSYDFYGITARNSRVEQIDALLFTPTNVGETTTATIVVRNTGNSRLLVEDRSVQLIASDKDFVIESVFAGADKDNGRYVIPVNQSGEIVVRFTPRANGTRLTTLVMMTNDSTAVNGSVGRRYVPITGVGIARGLIDVAAVGSVAVPFSLDTAIVAVPATYDEAEVQISNDGNAELNILEVVLEGADAADYSIVTPVNPMTLGIGQSETVRLRFAPATGGDKSASLVVRSSAENGTQAVDLRGFAGERLTSTTTPELFVDKQIAVSEKAVASAIVRNTGTVDLSIDPAVIAGANAGDYAITGSNPAQVIAPGDFVTIPVEFTGSERGSRSATLTVNNNSTNQPALVVNLGGFVGVRSNTHTPDQISMSSTLLPNGEYEEKEVCVQVQNTGDIPMLIISAAVSGSQASEFEVDDKANTVVAPGESVTVCVRYRPTQSAPAAAMLTILTNGTPGTIEVPINGIATSVGESYVSAGGNVLEQSRPNPAVESSELVYQLATGGMVSLELYDMHGRSVRSIIAGAYREAGEHRERVDVRNIESGVYIYRLKVNGYELRSTMVVVK